MTYPLVIMAQGGYGRLMTNFPGEIGETMTATVGGVVQLHCAEHFPAEVKVRKIDDDGYAIMDCPAGHAIIEMT